MNYPCLYATRGIENVTEYPDYRNLLRIYYWCFFFFIVIKKFLGRPFRIEYNNAWYHIMIKNKSLHLLRPLLFSLSYKNSLLATFVLCDE